MRKITYQHTEAYSLYELVTSVIDTDLPLTYTDEDNNTKTFATKDQVINVLERFYDRLVLIASDTELTTAQKRTAFLKLYNGWWSRRGQEFGRLMEALLKEYDPLSNYDRREEGRIITTHDIGARSETDNLTDSFAATQHTKTETPRVSDTLTDTTAPKQETITETPRAETTTTTTPGVKTTTTTTPGVVTTTENSVYGDNSSVEVPQSKTVVTPNATTPDVITTEYDSTTPDVVTVAGTDGTNTTLTSTIQTIDTHVTSHDGQNTTVDADIARIDTHNRSKGSVAAKDTDTQAFDEYRVFGNIGVTSNVQLLTGELELRGTYDLITHALVEFIDSVSVYC